ncbi:LOW QUALITY PROTEIN: hypothetical protein NLU13_4268 [Sarocladium strictum]|uniref:Zn(2)-C6 fungal-type domain-containing protein n=1 Tax=Sarocladium strictum TaxID=5046 RepID=A0AA39L8R5_SARSR|nr:LOW QUALITY PROTEIN: hypothetical protein NLU13_4268 [Sarocladium strictum]
MMAVLDFEERATVGQTAKRPAPQAIVAEPTRKRAPYAPRACDACRRRKGRCSGGNPCSYCFARSLHCGGAFNASSLSYCDESEPSAVVDQDASRDVDSCSVIVVIKTDRHQHVSSPFKQRRPYESSSKVRKPWKQLGLQLMLQSSALPVEELIANLQEQIGTLTSRLKLVESKGSSSFDNSNSNTAQEQTRPSIPTSLSEASPRHRREPESPRQRLASRLTHRKRFCGPTSPDYSLNIAQIRLHQANLGDGAEDRQPKLPSIDDHQSDDEDSLNDEEDETISGIVSSRSLEKLTGFRRLLSKDHACRLVQTYQEVFHSLHPILDISGLVAQVEAWYGQSSSTTIPSTEEFTLLSINLVLAIALCAEPSSGVDIGKAIYAYCKEAIHRTTICPAPDLNNAVIALLVGIYHFFRDQLRFAWRMCGLAGVMLLELGLHSRDFPEHLLSPDCDRAQITAIICTTIVLDRQWSAATGLPTHFQESHFKSAMKSPVESPYLKAMVSFMAVSDKFTSAMAQRASAPEPPEEDDSFDILNFQIEQWRRNSLGRYNMAVGAATPPLPLSRIPSWAVLLNLRANAAHSMLLRPFFFTTKPTESSRRNLGPALRLFSDTVNVLSALDRSTSVYRMQLPFYVHLLASACALMSLVVVHVAQNKAALRKELPDDFMETVCRTFQRALDVAARHAATSRASQKLQKRLASIGSLLTKMSAVAVEKARPAQPITRGATTFMSDGPISPPSRPSRLQRHPESVSSRDPKRDQASQRQHVMAEHNPERSFESAHNIRAGSSGDTTLYYAAEQPLTHDMTPFVMPNGSGDGFVFASLSPNGSNPFGHGSSSLGQWPLVGGNAFFSEGELLFDE